MASFRSKKNKYMICILVGVIAIVFVLEQNLHRFNYIDLNNGVKLSRWNIFSYTFCEKESDTAFSRKFKDLLPPSPRPNWVLYNSITSLFSQKHYQFKLVDGRFNSFAECHDDIIGPERTRFYLDHFMAMVANDKDFPEDVAYPVISYMRQEQLKLKKIIPDAEINFELVTAADIENEIARIKATYSESRTISIYTDSLR